MSNVDFDGPPSLYFDASETGESTKCRWVGVLDGKARKDGKKIRSIIVRINGEGDRRSDPEEIKNSC